MHYYFGDISIVLILTAALTIGGTTTDGGPKSSAPPSKEKMLNHLLDRLLEGLQASGYRQLQASAVTGLADISDVGVVTNVMKVTNIPNAADVSKSPGTSPSVSDGKRK